MRTQIKTKLVALRMQPELHAELVKLNEAFNQNKWSYGKKSISQLLCDAAMDMVCRNQDRQKKIYEQIKAAVKDNKDRKRPVVVYNGWRSSDVILD